MSRAHTSQPDGGLPGLRPDWSAPARVRAWCTLRSGGFGRAPYDSLNLAEHVGDDPRAVSANRALLCERLALPSQPVWLSQVHGTRAVEGRDFDAPPEADACYALRAGVVCAVMVADCLPVLFCDRAGTRVAAAHAGWRGLAAGVLEATLAALRTPPHELLAWLGPAIGAGAYEVGEEVRAAFTCDDPGAAECFTSTRARHWRADLAGLARRRLAALGVGEVSGGEHCTHSDPQRFFSYRRDGATGRMAALIWLEE